MSDTRLRELRRRFDETGAPQDEAAWLNERVRMGELSRERLELAAYCGHEAARRVIGASVVAAPRAPAELVELFSEEVADLEWFIRGLARWGVPWCARAALAIGRHVLPLAGPFEDEAAAALRATETWLRCPCEEHRAAVRVAGETANDLVTPFTDTSRRLSVWTAGDVTFVAWQSIDGAERAARAAGEVVRRASQIATPAALRATVARALVAEAL